MTSCLYIYICIYTGNKSEFKSHLKGVVQQGGNTHMNNTYIRTK